VSIKSEVFSVSEIVASEVNGLAELDSKYFWSLG
jgi:hypothetical protein